MRIAPFLLAGRPMHPEHAEHYATSRAIYLDHRMLGDVTIIVRVSRAAGWRLRISAALMRLAGKIGGFKQVRFVRKAEE